MLPPKAAGTITYIAEPGEYNIDVSEDHCLLCTIAKGTGEVLLSRAHTPCAIYRNNGFGTNILTLFYTIIVF